MGDECWHSRDARNRGRLWGCWRLLCWGGGRLWGCWCRRRSWCGELFRFHLARSPSAFPLAFSFTFQVRLCRCNILILSLKYSVTFRTEPLPIFILYNRIRDSRYVTLLMPCAIASITENDQILRRSISPETVLTEGLLLFALAVDFAFDDLRWSDCCSTGSSSYCWLCSSNRIGWR